MSDPWFKFFPSDWRQDPMLRMCSMAARGLWIEMISLMHQATPYGHLLVSGQSPTDAQLAALVGCPSDQIPPLVAELEAAGVFSRARTGVIYSRKMTRMQKKAATARNNGRKGGNPTLGKATENPPLDNPEDKAGDKPQNQKLEPELKPEAKASVKKRTVSQMPDDWALSKALGDWAVSQGMTEADVRHQAEQFRVHHLAKGSKFKAWDMAWKKWVGNAMQFKAERAKPANGKPKAGTIRTTPDGRTQSYDSFLGWQVVHV